MMIYYQIRNQSFSYSGLDSPETCVNKKHFLDYKKNVDYKFNSWGCRDNEPPTNLQQLIWCVGDSFTVGLGQPFEEIWPQLLEKEIKIRCMNISQDGCPNDVIATRAIEILQNHNPKKIIILWSFFHRRFIDGNFLHFHTKSNAENDLKNFLSNFNKVNQYKNVLNYVIPGAFIDQNAIALEDLELQKLLDMKLNVPIKVVKQLDKSRDGYHFDILTCEALVKDIKDKL